MIGNKRHSKMSNMSHSGPSHLALSAKLSCVVLAGLLFIGTPGTADAAKIMVDAGHGGSDPGAIGVNGLKEKEVNLDIALRLQSELLFRGYEVAMTRQDDRYISLADRVAITDGSKSDLFVSVHSNSNPSGAASGTQVLYYDSAYPQSDYPASDAMTALTPQSKNLAQSVLTNVLATAKLADKGLIPSAVFVVRMGQIPSVLVETAFLSNATDAALLSDNAMRQKFAVGIANGIQAVLAPTESAVFADMQRHWAKDAVLRLKDKGIVESAKSFNPDRSITRAELLTMLNRQFSFGDRLPGTPKPGTGATLFKDLPATHWAADVLYKAYALTFVEGYPDQTIRPDQPVSRAEAAALLQRIMLIAKPDKPPASTGFSDVPKDHWAAGAIVQLSQKGLLNGVADNKFAPEKSMTRAEMATLLDRVKPADIPKPPTTPTPKPSGTPNPSAAPNPSATPNPGATPSPSSSPTPHPTSPPNPSGSPAPTPSASPNPTVTPGPSPTPSPGVSATPSVTATGTPTAN